MAKFQDLTANSAFFFFVSFLCALCLLAKYFLGLLCNKNDFQPHHSSHPMSSSYFTVYCGSNTMTAVAVRTLWLRYFHHQRWNSYKGQWLWMEACCSNMKRKKKITNAAVTFAIFLHYTTLKSRVSQDAG